MSAALRQFSAAQAWIDSLPPVNAGEALVEAWLFSLDGIVIGVGRTPEQARARGLRRELELWFEEPESDKPALAWVATSEASGRAVQIRGTADELLAFVEGLGVTGVAVDLADVVVGVAAA